MMEPVVWTAAHAAASFHVPQHGDDKYSRGVLGVRTGSIAYPGAAVLGVEAAWRTGLGMVRYVGPEVVGACVLTARPETVLGEGRVQAWLVGSGTDASSRGRAETQAIAALLEGTLPVVVDAGALDLVVGSVGGAPLVLTPHDREFARLEEAAGISSAPATPLAVRIAATRALADRLGHVVLRKGAATIVAAPGGWCATVNAGTPWLATAGTGDVLGGVIGALVAAHAARDASGVADDLGALAASGAWVHGVAGRIAAGLAPEAPDTDTDTRAGTNDAAWGIPITALDVAHALPAAVASVIARVDPR